MLACLLVTAFSWQGHDHHWQVTACVFPQLVNETLEIFPVRARIFAFFGICLALQPQ